MNTKKFFKAWCVFVLILVLVGSAYAKSSQDSRQNVDGLSGRPLVIDGNPKASILLQKDHSDREREGASELQLYIEKSTGAKLPVMMFCKSSYIIHLEISLCQKLPTNSVEETKT